MSPQPFAHRRCRNHTGREAVVRCPGCSFDFCRECVTEHDERLLCSLCLAKLAVVQAPRQRLRSIRFAILGALGLLAAWLFFFGTGEVVNAIVSRQEVRLWHAR
jgi:hypothetical protein